MYIFFASNNSVTSQILEGEKFRQGDINVNTIFASSVNYTNLSYMAWIQFERPDGSKTPEIPMTATSFSYLTVVYNGFKFTINDPYILAQYGSLKATVRYKNGAGVIASSGTVIIPVEQTVYNDDPNITITQYNILLSLFDKYLQKVSRYYPHVVSALPEDLVSYLIGGSLLEEIPEDLTDYEIGAILFVAGAGDDLDKVYEVYDNDGTKDTREVYDLNEYLSGTILFVKASDTTAYDIYEVYDNSGTLDTRLIQSNQEINLDEKIDAEITKLLNGTYTVKKSEQDKNGHDIDSTYGNFLTFAYDQSTRVLTVRLYAYDETLLDTKTATIALSSGSVAGLMSSAHYTKLTALPTNAELIALLDLKADKATTLDGYGITDAYTQTETDNLLDDKADLIDGKVPSSQLPSYVDDVLEYANLASFPATGEAGKIYIALDTNKTYRWSGSAYVEISASLALGETSSTAYRGDRGKTAYDHSQVVSGNPHGVTKSDVGLGNVDNTSDANKPVSTATQTELNKKANIDGYYAQLHSGLADNLASPDGVTDTDGYAFRTSAGSQSITNGYAELKKVLGNTVVWNQKVQNGNFTSISNWTNYRSTGSVTNNVYTLVGNADEVYCSILQDVGSVVGHKYYIRGEVMTPDSDISQIRIAFDNSISGGQLSPTAGTWYKQSIIRTAVDTQGRAEALLYHATSINGKTLNVRNVFVLDLTLMFGVGNEPTTTSAVELLFSLDYYAHSLPTLKSVDIDGIKTVGFNLFNGTYAKVVAGVKVNVAGTFTDAEFALSVDGTKSAVSLTEETINDTTCHTFTPTYSGYLFINGSDTTTCVSNVWSGYRVGDFEEYWTETRAINSSTYFPNGMRGVKVWNGGVASEVRDELLPDKYIKRFEIIDLGTLTWYVSASGTANERQATTGLNAVIKRPATANIIAHIVTSKYVADSGYNTSEHIHDKAISVGEVDGNVRVYDSALIGKTSAEIKTAMSGVYLVYELATPIETSITPALPFTYRISDFGTEEWVQTSVPSIYVCHETFYMSNLRDSIRRLPLDYYNKDAIDALLTTKTPVAISHDCSSGGYVGISNTFVNTKITLSITGKPSGNIIIDLKAWTLINSQVIIDTSSVVGDTSTTHAFTPVVAINNIVGIIGNTLGGTLMTSFSITTVTSLPSLSQINIGGTSTNRFIPAYTNTSYQPHLCMSIECNCENCMSVTPFIKWTAL